MDRYAIFVDAGYFFAAGANAAFSQDTKRKQVTVNSRVNSFYPDLSRCPPCRVFRHSQVVKDLADVAVQSAHFFGDAGYSVQEGFDDSDSKAT